MEVEALNRFLSSNTKGAEWKPIGIFLGRGSGVKLIHHVIVSSLSSHRCHSGKVIT